MRKLWLLLAVAFPFAAQSDDYFAPGYFKEGYVKAGYFPATSSGGGGGGDGGCVWDAGVWAVGLWADGVWDDNCDGEGGGGGTIAVPNVIGEESSAAADAILEAEMLDLGGVTARCSVEPEDQVVGQSPGPGVLVDEDSLVDLLVSNGIACVNRGRNGVRLNGVRMKGL